MTPHGYASWYMHGLFERGAAMKGRDLRACPLCGEPRYYSWISDAHDPRSYGEWEPCASCYGFPLRAERVKAERATR